MRQAADMQQEPSPNPWPAPDASPPPGPRTTNPGTARQDPPLDWWKESPREAVPQWSLGELFVLTAGAAGAAAVARTISPVILASLLGVIVILGWIALHLDDWETRWAVVVWRVALVAYLTSILTVMMRQN